MTRARCRALLADARVRSKGVRRLLARPAEHVAEDQDGALPGRQVLDSHDERQLDGLLGHRPLVWVVQLGCRATAGGKAPRCQTRLPPVQVCGNRRTVSARLEVVQAGVCGVPEEPVAQRCPSLERRPPGPGAQERLLSEVLGVVVGREHPVAGHQERRRKRSVSSANPPASPVRATLYEIAFVGADRTKPAGVRTPSRCLPAVAGLFLQCRRWHRRELIGEFRSAVETRTRSRDTNGQR